MKEHFTTGEMAQECNVSVRTLQYYDKEGLLKPSEISEGGRRLYTEESLTILKCICLYKTLGFSLGEIKSILNEISNNEFFEKILNEQGKKLDEQIKKLTQSRETLKVLTEELNDTGTINIKSIDEVNSLIKKKENHKKTDVMTYIFIGCYLLIALSGFPIAESIDGISPLIFTAILIILLLSLVYYHKENSSYICPNCHYKFSISFFKDLFSFNGISKGKYIRCPHCLKKGWLKETFKDWIGI